MKCWICPSGISCYAPTILLWIQTWICHLSQVKSLSKIILLQITPLFKISQAPLKFLQRTSMFKIINVLSIIMILDLKILLHTCIILLCNLLNTKHLCTKFLASCASPTTSITSISNVFVLKAS